MAKTGYFNVWLLSTAFMLLFTAFHSLNITLKTMLDGFTNENGNFTADGYFCLAIIYFTIAIVKWFTPAIVIYIGPRISIIVGAVCYIGYIACFLYPIEIVIYIMSVILGLGAALIWTAEMDYLLLNTPKLKMSRNTGLFWAFLQFSMIFGNIIVFVTFSDEHIDIKNRDLFLFILLGIAVVSLLVFIFLPKTVPQEGPIEVIELFKNRNMLKGAGRLLKTKHMLSLLVPFLFSGLELSFLSGVYGPAVGFTEKLYLNSKRWIGFCGICIGLGEVLGGTLFGLFGETGSRIGRSTIYVMGSLFHLVSFALIFLNLPNKSTFRHTSDDSVVKSNVILVFVSAFTMGFADSCYNTQFYAILSTTYRRQPASAFVIYTCVQNLGTFIGFVYTIYSGLYISLGILTAFCIISVILFVISENIDNKERPPNINVRSEEDLF